MIVGFDARPAFGQATGVGVYLKQLLPELLKKCRQDDQLVAFYSSLKARPKQHDWMSDRHFRLIDRRISVRLLNLIWHNLPMPKVELFCGAMDVFHTLHPVLVPSRAGRQVMTIFDLYFLEHPEWTAKEVRRDYRRRIKDSATRADVIITPSILTKNQVIGLLGINPAKIEVIPLGVDSRFHLAERQVKNGGRQVRPHYLPSSYFLSVGTLEPRKNYPFLIRSYARALAYEPNLPTLLVVGKQAHDTRRILSTVEQTAIKEKIVFTDYIAFPDLPIVYQQSLALLHPAHGEGFGLPLLEAAATGTPVIAGEQCGVLEVLNKGILIPQSLEEDWAENIVRLFKDADMRHSLGAAAKQMSMTLTWQRSAELHWQVYLREKVR